MPKRRLPKEVWDVVRRIVWLRDNRQCQHCGIPLKLNECHIDHKHSGKLGTNKLNELRTLCRRCHVLRADLKHRGMIANAIRDGIIPPDWRPLLWDD